MNEREGDKRYDREALVEGVFSGRTPRRLTACALLLLGCDTFAPPPKRSSDDVNVHLAPPNGVVSVTAVPTMADRVSTVPVSTFVTQAPSSMTSSTMTSSSSNPSSSAPPSCGARVDRDGDGVATLDVSTCANAPTLTLAEVLALDCDDTDPKRSTNKARYADADGDGFGDEFALRFVCEGVATPGFVSDAQDCDDTDALAHERVYADQDGDGFGAGESSCGEDGADGKVLDSSDCNDQDASITPVAIEDVSYDGIDRNCDLRDIPVETIEEAGELIVWDQGALCPGSVVAVVALEHVVKPPGGVYLQVGMVGTRDAFDAQLVLRKADPPNADIVTTIALPNLAPAQVFRTELITVGRYVATFDYALGAAPVVPTTGEQSAPSAGSTAQVDAASPVDPCALAQVPFEFSAARVEPL